MEKDCRAGRVTVQKLRKIEQSAIGMFDRRLPLKIKSFASGFIVVSAYSPALREMHGSC